MRTLALALLLLAGQGTFAAGPSLAETVQKLTLESIAVNTEIETCGAKDLPYMNAGGVLERDYENFLSEVETAEFNLKNWRKLSAKDCLKDCSCFALSRAFEKYPPELQKKISRAVIEAKLAKMTNEDYKKCRAQKARLCQAPEISEFLARLKKTAE